MEFNSIRRFDDVAILRPSEGRNRVRGNFTTDTNVGTDDEILRWNVGMYFRLGCQQIVRLAVESRIVARDQNEKRWKMIKWKQTQAYSFLHTRTQFVSSPDSPTTSIKNQTWISLIYLWTVNNNEVVTILNF